MRGQHRTYKKSSDRKKYFMKDKGIPIYKTREDNPSMGLYNRICTKPAGICRSKNVLLSKEDIENKQCLNKPIRDCDIPGFEVCECFDRL